MPVVKQLLNEAANATYKIRVRDFVRLRRTCNEMLERSQVLRAVDLLLLLTKISKAMNFAFALSKSDSICPYCVELEDAAGADIRTPSLSLPPATNAGPTAVTSPSSPATNAGPTTMVE